MRGEGRPTGNGRRREAHREWEEKGGGPQGVAVMTISAGPTSQVEHHDRLVLCSSRLS